MTGEPTRPGWWQASDDEWYPPDRHPDPEHRARWAAADADADPTVPTPAAPGDVGGTVVLPTEPVEPTEPTQPTPPVPPGEVGGTVVLAAEPPEPAPPGDVGGTVVRPTEPVDPPPPSPAGPPPQPAAAAPPPARPPSPPPPSPTPSPGAAPGRSRRGRWVVALVAFVAILAGTVVVLVTRNASTPSADAATVRLEPVGFVGDDPFATDLTIHEVAAFPDGIKPVGETASGGPGSTAASGADDVKGTTPGLYGGTNDVAACDPAQLKAFLRDNPDKARVWAAVQGLSGPEEIDEFIDKLTPVVLTTDTRVTNHGFKDGRSNAFDAVLQRGTAVLVDSTGVPRTKCACGNPLLKPPPQPIAATPVGNPWPGYQPSTVVVVQPGAVVTNLQVVNIQSGQLVSVPVGAAPGVVVALAEPQLGPQGGKTPFLVNAKGFDPSSWETAFTAPDRVDGVGFGDGRFLAVGHAANGAAVYAGDATGHGWAQVATIPGVSLRDVAFGAGRWLAVGGAAPSPSGGTTGGSNGGLVFESTDGKTWNRVAEIGAEDLDGSSLTSVAFGGGRWAVTVQSGHEPIVSVFTSADGKAWEHTDLRGTRAVVGYGEDAGWLAAGRNETAGPGGPSTPSTTWSSPDAQTWRPATTNGYIPFYGGVTRIDGRWYASAWDQQGSGLQGIVASGDGVTWTTVPGPQANGSPAQVDDFAFSGGSLPGGSSGGPAAGAPTTSAPGAATSGSTTIAASGNGQILRNAGGPGGPTWESVYRGTGPITGVAFGNGSFVAISGKGCSSAFSCQTVAVVTADASGQSWSEVATVPAALYDVAYGNGRWLAVGTSIGARIQTAVAYESTDLRSWRKLAPTLTGAEGGFTSVAFANGRWAAVVFSGETALVARSQLATSADGVAWQAASADAVWARGFAGVAAGGGGWLAIGPNEVWDGTGPLSDTEPVGLAATSRDGSAWQTSPTTPTALSVTAPVFAGGRWYAVGVPPRSPTPTRVDVHTSTDGKSWSVAGGITIPPGSGDISGTSPVVDLAAAS